MPSKNDSVDPSEEEYFPYRVLLVEDNQVNQELAKEILEMLGLTVDIANDGAEAVQAYLNGRYDLIFMDCQMPNMNGYEATRCIREIEQVEQKDSGKLVPIVALTAHAFEDAEKACFEAGMSDYLSKPYNVRQMNNMIGRWLKRIPKKQLAESVTTQDNLIKESFNFHILDNLKALQKQSGSNLLKKVVTIYLNIATGQIEQIEQAIERGDFQTIKEVAHSMKSSSANLGAEGISALCNNMEKAGQEKNAEVASQLFEQLKKEYENVKKILSLELEN
jgi:CheY-like chemotaxis protein